MSNTFKNHDTEDLETELNYKTQKQQILLQLSKRIKDNPNPNELLEFTLKTLYPLYHFDIIFLSDFIDPPEFVSMSSKPSLTSEDIASLLMQIFNRKWNSNTHYSYMSVEKTELQPEFEKIRVKSLFIQQMHTFLFPDYLLGFINLGRIFQPKIDDYPFFQTLSNIINHSISYYELKMLFEASNDKIQGKIGRTQRENEQRRELLRKVRIQTKELQQKNVEMEEFVYTISHDLKAPIISIQGFVSALNEDLKEELPEDAKFYLERITQNTLQVKSMILEILEYSRIGRVTQEKAKLNL
ncbi:MAG: histidine kinase dimerization/phospho-acceptor domain-containing protein, partial [Candidatus Hodarchaeales archaeon]